MAVFKVGKNSAGNQKKKNMKDFACIQQNLVIYFLLPKTSWFFVGFFISYENYYFQDVRKRI